MAVTRRANAISWHIKKGKIMCWLSAFDRMLLTGSVQLFSSIFYSPAEKKKNDSMILVIKRRASERSLYIPPSQYIHSQGDHYSHFPVSGTNRRRGCRSRFGRPPRDGLAETSGGGAASALIGGAESTNWAHVRGGAGSVISVTGSRNEAESGPIDGKVSSVVEGRGCIEANSELRNVAEAGPVDGAVSGVAEGRGGDVEVVEANG